MMVRRLWLGGSSGLTRTYLNVFPSEEWILVGHQPDAPSWMPETCEYKSLDLTQRSTAEAFWKDMPETLETIVVGIRPPLVTPRTDDQAWDANRRILDGLRAFLDAAPRTMRVLHISSIAAIDHLQGQVQVNEETPEVSLSDLKSPYDAFKRECEEIVEACSERHTSLRLGAIFSDDPGCIQCNALALQAYVGVYLPTAIDCNSSYNVAQLIHSCLEQRTWKESIYYYTRPLRYGKETIPYGEYLVSYRKAYGIPRDGYVSLPMWFVDGFVALVHVLAGWFGLFLPYLAAVDYLLQVSTKEHSFDLSRCRRDFPKLKEESFDECFARRRKNLEGPKSKTV